MIVDTRQATIFLSILFLSFSLSSGYISVMPTYATRWICQFNAGHIPTLVQVDAGVMLSILYISMGGIKWLMKFCEIIHSVFLEICMFILRNFVSRNN
jgi:hypothetical protein